MTPRPARRPVRALAAAVVLVAVAVPALAGCSVTNTITTQRAYEASDGVGVDLGGVRAGNLLVVAADEGGPGSLVGYLTNEGDSAAVVAVGPAGGEPVAVVRLAPGATALLGQEHERVDVPSVSEPPGALVLLGFAVEDGDETVVEVPVVDGTLPEYATLVPAPPADGD